MQIRTAFKIQGEWTRTNKLSVFLGGPTWLYGLQLNALNHPQDSRESAMLHRKLIEVQGLDKGCRLSDVRLKKFSLEPAIKPDASLIPREILITTQNYHGKVGDHPMKVRLRERSGSYSSCSRCVDPLLIF